MPKLQLFALLTGLSATAISAAPPLIENGRFDAGIEGWTAPGTPGVEVAWDSGGNPGGSLRMTVSTITPNRQSVLSPCISGPPGHYFATGETYHPSPSVPFMACQVEIRGWQNEDCSGQEYAVLGPQSPPPLDVWFPNTIDMGLEYPLDEPPRSISVALTSWRLSSLGEQTCYFDNVSLIRAGAAAEIPTVAPGGLVILMAALALAAGLRLHGRAS